MDDLTPITREETFLAAAGGQSVTLPEPLTREELFLAKAAGESVETPEPITRKEMFLDAIQSGGGGGITVEALTVTENGTYTAEEGTAYSPVTANVPNSYTSADEGKAVQNGALAAQTAATKTGVGTYNTTYNNSVTFQLGALTNGAAAADIASGKTAYGANGSVITGTASGGGNPNYAEHISGTLANPWGDANPATLHSQMQDGEVSVFLNITVPGEGQATFMPSPTSNWWWFSAVVTYDPDSHVVIQAMYLAYLVSGELNLAYLYKDGTATDMSGMAAMFQTTLTIIHHPLPDSGS